MSVSGVAGSFIFGGLAANVWHFFTREHSPEMFGWYGAFLVVGIHLSIFCLPGCLIIAGFNASRGGPLQIALCFPFGGVMALLGLVAWYQLRGLDEAFYGAIISTASAVIALIFCIIRRRLQNNPIQPTGDTRAGDLQEGKP